MGVLAVGNQVTVSTTNSELLHTLTINSYLLLNPEKIEIVEIHKSQEANSQGLHFS